MKAIIDYLTKEFESELPADTFKDFKNWLRAAAKEDNDSKRLLYCLAIDVKSELVDREKYVELFCKINYSSLLNSKQKFANAVNDLKGMTGKISNDLSGKGYSSLVDLETFAFRVLNKAKKNYIKHDDLPRVKDALVRGEIDGIEVERYSKPKPGAVFWVAETSALARKKKEIDEGDRIERMKFAHTWA